MRFFADFFGRGIEMSPIKTEAGDFAPRRVMEIFKAAKAGATP
jgi:hypothetical protein